MTYQTPIEKLLEKKMPPIAKTPEETVKRIFDFIFNFLDVKIKMLDQINGLNDPYNIGRMEVNMELLDAMMILCARCGYNGGNDGHQIQHDLADINEIKATIKNFKEMLMSKI